MSFTGLFTAFLLFTLINGNNTDIFLLENMLKSLKLALKQVELRGLICKYSLFWPSNMKNNLLLQSQLLTFKFSNFIELVTIKYSSGWCKQFIWGAWIALWSSWTTFQGCILHLGNARAKTSHALENPEDGKQNDHEADTVQIVWIICLSKF